MAKLPALETIHRRNIRIALQADDRGTARLKIRPLFKHLLAFAKNHANVAIVPNNTLAELVAQLQGIFPGLANTKTEVLHSLLDGLLGHGDAAQYSAEHTVNLTLLVSYPQHAHLYADGNIQFLYRLLAHGECLWLFKPEERTLIRDFMIKLIEEYDGRYIDDLNDFSLRNEMNRVVHTFLTGMAYAKLVGKELNLEYIRLGVGNLPMLLSLGLTHRDCLKCICHSKGDNAFKYLLANTTKHQIEVHLEDILGSAGMVRYGSRAMNPIGEHLKDRIAPRAEHLPAANWYLLTNSADEYREFMGVGDESVDRLRYLFMNTDENPIQRLERDLTQCFSDIRMVTISTMSLFKWVLRHRQWFDKFTEFEHKGQKLVIHNHTIIKELATHVYLMDSSIEIDVRWSPTELLSKFEAKLNKMVQIAASEREEFAPAPFHLKPTIIDGEELEFRQLTDSLQLQVEGSNMANCIGGYGYQMVKPHNFAFHVDSSKGKGYTLHAIFERGNLQNTEVSQLRGYANSNASKELHHYIATQLEEQTRV